MIVVATEIKINITIQKRRIAAWIIIVMACSNIAKLEVIGLPYGLIRVVALKCVGIEGVCVFLASHIKGHSEAENIFICNSPVANVKESEKENLYKEVIPIPMSIIHYSMRAKTKL